MMLTAGLPLVALWRYCSTPHLQERVSEVSGHGHHLVLGEQSGNLARHEHRVHHFEEHLEKL